MRKVLLFAFSALLLFSCKKDEADSLSLQPHDENAMMQIMHEMMSRMDTMQKTNDPEIDFARMMKMHHQGAIDMANLELQRGASDTMKRFAQKVIDEQQREIQQFNTILSMITVDNSDPAFSMEQMENMQKGGRVADVQLITGDIDNDFATLMIVHHQGAVDNANAYLHHGNYTPLKDMATSTVQSQVSQIDELANWLRANRR